MVSSGSQHFCRLKTKFTCKTIVEKRITAFLHLFITQWLYLLTIFQEIFPKATKFSSYHEYNKKKLRVNNKGSSWGGLSKWTWMWTLTSLTNFEAQEGQLQWWQVMACYWIWRPFLKNEEIFLIPNVRNCFSSYVVGMEKHCVYLNASLPMKTHLQRNLQIISNKFSLLPIQD